MKVLITDAGRARAGEIADELRACGHDVAFCRERGTAESTPCIAMTPNGTCPLDSGGVDVVLDLRLGDEVGLVDGEYGVVCAYRTNVPLIVAERRRSDQNFPGWQAATCSAEDAVGTCEAVFGTTRSGRQAE